MIWALLIGAIIAATAGAGGADALTVILEDWYKGLEKFVEDDTRREAGLALLQDFEQELDGLTDQLREDVTVLAEVHRDYEATLDDYATHVDSMQTKLLDFQIHMIDVGLEMRETVGPENHAKISVSLKKKARKREEKQQKVAESKAKKAAKEADKKAAKEAQHEG